MGFWRFIRDMMVLDWLSGTLKGKSCGERDQWDDMSCDDSSDNDFCGGYNDYDPTGYNHFDDDFDSGMYDDLDSDLFDDDF